MDLPESAPRVLVVEDEHDVLTLIERTLTERGFRVEAVIDAESALRVLDHTPTDILVLDVGLPDRDGISLTSEVRERGLNVPILLLTGRTSTRDRVAGLESGADDYLTKPFAIEELVARVRALLRRAARYAPPVLSLGGLCLNRDSRELAFGIERISLTSREAEVLEYLIRHVDEPVERNAIAAAVWGEERAGDDGTNVVEVYMAYLRKKLDTVGAPPILQTLRGVGYMLHHPQPDSLTIGRSGDGDGGGDGRSPRRKRGS